MKEKILDPCLDTDKFKPNWWLGFVLKKGGVINNWTPWCNADALLCFLLMEKDPVKLEHAIRQSARSVDLFLEYVSQDGACEEGPSYWGHAAGKLYDYLQIMYDASGGKFDMFSDKRIKDMGEYISRSYVQDGWVVNFADASARQGYSPSVIYNYGKAVGSQEMMDFAVHGLAKDDRFKNPTPVFGNDVYRSLESLRTLKNIEDASNEMNRRIQEGETVVSCQKYLRRDVPGFVWYPQTEFCYMRSGDWFVGMKGGHNNESHNHNDIGTFLLYIDGTPVFVDAGVGTYTKKTFGPDRFSIWSMQSDWHNLPMINGSSQVFGAQHRSSDVVASEKKSGGLFRLDIAGGYMDAAECKSWVRQYELKGSVLTITDTYELNKRVSADVENFLVQGEVVIGDDAVLVKNGDLTVRMEYPKGMTPSVDVMELDDPRLSNVWGNNLKRISFTSPADAPVKGKYIFKITELN